MNECEPPLNWNAVVVKTAWPAVKLTGVALSFALPSKKSTVPIGVPLPEPGETVAVNCTGVPNGGQEGRQAS